MMTNRSYRSLAFTAALGLFWCDLGTLASAGDAPAPATHTVTISGMRFHPEVLTVKTGDSVVWVNKDPYPHTATSQAGGFDSREIGPGKSWTYTARAKGEFPYRCTLHPTMRAMLRVH
jgi:plastocyanin